MSKELPLGFLRARDLLTRRADRAGHQRGISASVPPPVLVISSILSVQLGAAIAKSLFQSIGSSGTVFLRMGFAALILLLFWRPHLREYRRADYVLVVLFGLTIAAMNACFYAAIARIPLGIATTLEFVGPLGVAIAASRRRRDLLWVGLAAAGVALLAPIGKSAIDPLGIVFALLAGAGWATYILLNVRIGRAFTGGNGLALSMGVAALAFSPFGVTSGGGMLLNPNVLLVGVGVAVLSTVIPFSLELEALRRLPARVFGVLMSLEPAIAALIGFLVLREAIQVRGLIALTLIMAASAGVSFFQEREEH
ncbi:MAG TPA: EamA family transporter [Ktedonobacteraceae bacterium]|nr:EamA family transporter [Ktedonobacteraceae bacterium]